MFELIITVLFLAVIFITKACIQNKRRKPSVYDQVRIITPVKSEPKKPTQKPVEAPKKPVQPPKDKPKNVPSIDTIKALQAQADAERGLAEALERKAQYTTDPVKRARLDKQAATAWVRFNTILDRIDRITA